MVSPQAFLDHCCCYSSALSSLTYTCRFSPRPASHHGVLGCPTSYHFLSVHTHNIAFDRLGVFRKSSIFKECVHASSLLDRRIALPSNIQSFAEQHRHNSSLQLDTSQTSLELIPRTQYTSAITKPHPYISIHLTSLHLAPRKSTCPPLSPIPPHPPPHQRTPRTLSWPC